MIGCLRMHRKKNPWRPGLVASALLLASVALPAGLQADDAAPPSGPLALDDCVRIGMGNQPAIAAAESSLGAALAGQQGLNNLRFAGLLSRDIRVRRDQAALGVEIAAAGVDLAHWETRYAVIRNFFSVMYAHQQAQVARSVTDNLDTFKKLVETFLMDAKVAKDLKITQNDVKTLSIYLALYRTKQVEAETGMQRAIAALREAMGYRECCPLDLLDTPLPDLVDGITCKETVALALERRGELAQAATAHEVSGLEIDAQSRLWFRVQAKTFAAGSDVHSRPIPQGIINHEYRPGAIGLEMPVYIIGRRGDRVDRASEFYGRASAVVEKTENLISLEAEAAYYKWKEASQKVKILRGSVTLASELLFDVRIRFQQGGKKGAVTVDDYIKHLGLEDQARAQYNEALYLHALALANLERVTAGGLKPTYAGTFTKR